MSTNEFGEEKNGICNWCGDELPIEDLKDNDFGVLGLHKVCCGCYEDLKSEYGVIDVPDTDNF